MTGPTTGGRPAPGRRNARYTVLDVDGPPPIEMIRGTLALRADPLGWLERTHRRYGDLVALPLPRTPVLLVNTIDGARRVLQENHRGYGKATVQYRSLALVTGEGLLTADGDLWRRHRRIAQPAFSHGSLDRVADQIAPAVQQLRTDWAAAGPDTPVDADADVLQAMVQVVGRTLFADDLAGAGDRVVTAVEAALTVVVHRARTPLGAGRLAALPSPSRHRLRRALADLDAVCAELVARRRGSGYPDPDADLLALLLRSADADGLTERQVRDEVVTMVIAGHETVASCLSWTLHLLAGHPQVQHRLHAELDAVLGRPTPEQPPTTGAFPTTGAIPTTGAVPTTGAAGEDESPGIRNRVPTWADLPSLGYIRAVVEESLRLYPPAWVISRQALEPDVISGVPVPAGSLVILSPWLLHRRADRWPRPEEFDPGRFADAARRRDGYLPFGAGPRLCIGRDLALVEVVLILAGLLRDHDVRHPPGAPPPQVEALVTLRPRHGLPLLFRARSGPGGSSPAAPPTARS